MALGRHQISFLKLRQSMFPVLVANFYEAGHMHYLYYVVKAEPLHFFHLIFGCCPLFYNCINFQCHLL